MKRFFNQSFYAVLLGACALFLFACDVSESDSSTETTDEETGASLPDADDGFTALVTTNDNYTVIMTKDGDGASTCEASLGQRVTCILDIEENDLYSNGVKIGYAAPQSQCDYVGTIQYYFSWAPFGVMPSGVYINTNEDTVVDVTTGTPSWLSAEIVENDTGGCVVGGACDRLTLEEVIDNLAASSSLGNNPDADIYTCSATNDADIVYTFDTDSDGWIDRVICHGDIFLGSPALESGDAKCPWDHSGQGSAASCCYGDYNNFTFDGTEAEATDSSWGSESNYGNCFRGPGMDSDAPKTILGTPSFVQTLVPTDGIQDSFDVAAPDTKLKEQIYATNYTEAADHTGGTATSTAYHGADMVAPTIAAWGYPAYEIDCLDHAYELKAQIRIFVREWNLQAEFDDFISGVLNAEDNSEDVSDPYDTGIEEQEEDFCDYRALERDQDGADATAGNELQCVYNTYGSFELSTNVETLGLVYNASDFYGVIPD